MKFLGNGGVGGRSGITKFVGSLSTAANHQLHVAVGSEKPPFFFFQSVQCIFLLFMSEFYL